LLDLANVYLLNLDFKNAKQYATQALSIDPMDSLDVRQLLLPVGDN
jgi:hypothetical protein